MAELLLAHGADVNAKDARGNTPLRYAEEKDHEEVGELLLVHQASPSELAQMVSPDHTLWLRRAALGALAMTDQARLMELTPGLPVADLRQFAVRRITNDAFLLARSREDPSAAVRTAAVEAMQSPQTILTVATESYYGDLRHHAAEFPHFDAAARARIAEADSARDLEIKNLAAETSPAALADKALNAKFDTVCRAAVERLTDQASLARVAMKTTDREVAKVALARLNDPTALGQVASNADDPAVRIAAQVALKTITWNEVFDQAARRGDSRSLGDALGAVSLSPVQGVTASVVTETCLTLIRRGDESRIPELIDLLTRYGDKPLAEDYLNCGQPDLGNAGGQWARSHGYYVSTGWGSNRARWGSSR